MTKSTPLTSQSAKRYNKTVAPALHMPLLELFLNIGLDLIELEPETHYINILTNMLVEAHPFGNQSELQMHAMQLQHFYNDAIAFYDEIVQVDVEKEEILAQQYEATMKTMIHLQEAKESKEILLGVITEAIEVIAIEYGFMELLEEASSWEEVFDYMSFSKLSQLPQFDESFKLLVMLEDKLSKETLSNEDLEVTGTLLAVALSSFNLLRKVRYEVEKNMASVGRNDPCPCGSGKKFKKCCMV